MGPFPISSSLVPSSSPYVVSAFIDKYAVMENSFRHETVGINLTHLWVTSGLLRRLVVALQV